MLLVRYHGPPRTGYEHDPSRGYDPKMRVVIPNKAIGRVVRTSSAGLLVDFSPTTNAPHQPERDVRCWLPLCQLRKLVKK